MRGILAPAGGAYYVLTPLLSGIAFIGFLDKYITAPSDRILMMEAADGGLDVRIRVPSGRSYHVGAFHNGEIMCEADGAEVVEESVKGGLHVCTVVPTGEEFTLRFRRGGSR
ncbi:MAG TPA: hypothetical protein ENH11_02165 [Candidatus Acetothermia bacterium]|nr:hypothetical protein [Candidatus Acetothermia bacterium]